VGRIGEVTAELQTGKKRRNGSPTGLRAQQMVALVQTTWPVLVMIRGAFPLDKFFYRGPASCCIARGKHNVTFLRIVPRPARLVRGIWKCDYPGKAALPSANRCTLTNVKLESNAGPDRESLSHPLPPAPFPDRSSMQPSFFRQLQVTQPGSRVVPGFDLTLLPLPAREATRSVYSLSAVFLFLIGPRSVGYPPQQLSAR
jgi:hypothetical protein